MKRILSLVAVVIIALATVVPVASADTASIHPMNDGFCTKDLQSGTVISCDSTGTVTYAGTAYVRPQAYAYRSFWAFSTLRDTWEHRSIISAKLTLRKYLGYNAEPLTAWLYRLESNPWPLDTGDYNATGYKTTWSAYDIYYSAPGASQLTVQQTFVRYKNYADRMDLRLQRTAEDLGSDTRILYYSMEYYTQQPSIEVEYVQNHTQNAPTNVGSTSVTINWQLSGALVSGDAQQVEVIQSNSQTPPDIDDAGWDMIGGPYQYTATSANITGLTANTSYWFRVVDYQYAYCPPGLLCAESHFAGSVSTAQHVTTNP